MRFSTTVLGASLGALISLSTTSAASAQGKGIPLKEPPRDFIGAEQFFAEPAVLGDGWQKAVTAALEAWRSAVSPAARAVDAAVIERASRPLPKPAPVVFRPVSPVIPARAAGGVDAPSPRFDVELGPVALVPASVVSGDGRGLVGVVPGFTLRLPWMIP